MEAPTQIDAIAGKSPSDDMIAIAVDRGQPFRQCRRCNLSAVADKHGTLKHGDESTRALASIANAPSISSGVLASDGTVSTPKVLPAASSSGSCGAAFGSCRLVSRPTFFALGTTSRASSICLAGNPAPQPAIERPPSPWGRPELF